MTNLERLMMVRLRFRRRFGGRAIQKIIFFLFLFAVLRSFGIVLFHFDFFFGSQRGQVPDETNQLPRIGASLFGTVVIGIHTAEGGHARQTHTVFDNPENVTVRKFLRFAGAEVGGLGIEAAAEHGISAAIVAVANCAVIGKMKTSFTLHVGRICDRIFLVMRVGGRRHFSSGARDEPVMQNTDPGRDEQGQDQDNDQQKKRAALHRWYSPDRSLSLDSIESLPAMILRILSSLAKEGLAEMALRNPKKKEGREGARC